MEEESELAQDQKKWHGTLIDYLIGFFLSLVFTLIAYFVVAEKWLANPALNYVIFSCAILQFIAQLLFFMHLNRESRPIWDVQILTYAFFTAIVLIFGSIWIMSNLNTRVMPKNWHSEMFENQNDQINFDTQNE